MKYYVKLNDDRHVIATFVNAGEGFPQIDLSDFFEVSFELFQKIGPDSKIENGEVVAGNIQKTQTSEKELTIIKSAKMSSAQLQVNPLQYAVDLSIATDDEVTKLKDWKTYLVELNRVDTTQENIEWPSEPIS